MQFTTIVEYETDNEQVNDADIISIDASDVVIGLQGFGVTPIRARSDGKKLVVDFEKSKVAGPFQKIQRSLAGAYQPLPHEIDLTQKVSLRTEEGKVVEVAVGDLIMDFYSRIIKGQSAWKGLLTMMRTVDIRK